MCQSPDSGSCPGGPRVGGWSRFHRASPMESIRHQRSAAMSARGKAPTGPAHGPGAGNTTLSIHRSRGSPRARPRRGETRWLPRRTVRAPGRASAQPHRSMVRPGTMRARLPGANSRSATSALGARRHITRNPNPTGKLWIQRPWQSVRCLVREARHGHGQGRCCCHSQTWLSPLRSRYRHFKRTQIVWFLFRFQHREAWRSSAAAAWPAASRGSAGASPDHGRIAGVDTGRSGAAEYCRRPRGIH